MNRLQSSLQAIRKVLAPHPGRILLEDFMEPAGISQNELARSMGVSPRRINEIVLGKRAITAETALGLSDVIGMSARYWMGLQADYDLDHADRRRAERNRRRELARNPGLTEQDRWRSLESGDDAARHDLRPFHGRRKLPP